MSPSKAQMLDNLRVMLKDVFRLRREGVTYARLTRAHGYVDGYMRVHVSVDGGRIREVIRPGHEYTSVYHKLHRL